MTTRRTAVGALVIAAAVAATGIAGCAGSKRSDLKSLRIFPTSTVADAAPAVPDASTTTVLPVPTSTVTGAVALPPPPPTTTTQVPTSVVARPAVTTTTTSRPATTARPQPVRPSTTASTAARPAGLVDEQSDNGYVFVYSNDPSSDASGSATELDRGTAPRRLDFSVSGGMDHSAVARFEVSITNLSGRQLSFPGGLDVRWVVQHNGAPWKTVHLTRPEITGLAPGAKLSGSQQAILDQFGDYSFTANVTVQYH